VLVDSGASHSFIPASLVRVLRLHVCDCESNDVMLPNGTRLRAKSYVRVPFEIQPNVV
jgi:hypothetical protein